MLYVLTMLTDFHGFVDSYSGLGFLLQFIINGREIYILAHPLEKVNQHGLEITGNSRKLGKSEMFSCHLLPSLAISCQRSLWLEAWMKLRSLAEGAQLATRHFLQQSAPVPCRSVGLASTPFRAVIFSSEEHWNVLESVLKLGDFMMDR